MIAAPSVAVGSIRLDSQLAELGGALLRPEFGVLCAKFGVLCAALGVGAAPGHLLKRDERLATAAEAGLPDPPG